MAGLPPLPLKDIKDFPFTLQEWLRQVQQLVGGTSGLIPWVQVNKTGSALTDLVTRNHNDLQNIQGGTPGQYYHMTSAEKTVLDNTSGVNTGDQTITLTGDVTGSGTGSFATTLASILASGGPIGSSTVIPIITWDAKGRLTAVSSASIPSISASKVELNNQSGSIGTTSIVTPAADGNYWLGVYCSCTTAGAAGTVDVTLNWIDDVGAQSKTMLPGALSLAATGHMQNAIFVRAKSTGAISYATTVSGVSGTPKYALYISAIKVG